MRASRTSIHDRHFTRCIEILGDNRLTWASRTFSLEIGPICGLQLPNFVFLTLRSIDKSIVLKLTQIDPFFSTAFSFYILFFGHSFLFFSLFLEEKISSGYFILSMSIAFFVSFVTSLHNSCNMFTYDFFLHCTLK